MHNIISPYGEKLLNCKIITQHGKEKPTAQDFSALHSTRSREEDRARERVKHTTLFGNTQ